MSLDDTKTVVTPEQVAVTYRIAGIGTRFAAVLVDTCAQVLAGLALILAFPPLEAIASSVYEGPSLWLTAVVALLGFLIVWGYFIFWETVWSGRTPGKRLAGIRVMRDGGFPVDFRAAFLRNICRYVDFLPVAYGFGVTVMFFSRESKRLGDYVAGTIVVVDSQRPSPRPEAPGEGQREYRLLGDLSLLNIRALTREQLAVVDRFLARREGLLKEPRQDLAQRIAAPLMEALSIEAPSDDYPYESFLEELAAAARGHAER